MRKGGTLSYLLADHLGGTTSVLDAAGNVTASRKYWPYGAERSVSGDQRATDRWYTGQRDEDFDGLGLYNYKARFYSTTLGRFVSADPVTPSGHPVQLNRYAYVHNAPLNKVDPDGKCVRFFTEHELPCSPEIALQLLDCSISVQACMIFMVRHGVTVDPRDASRGHAFARWAVEGESNWDFWESFFRADIYPFNPENARTLGPYPNPFESVRLLNLGAQRFTPSDAASVRGFTLDVNRWCEVSCAAVGRDLIHLNLILAGYYTGNPNAVIFGMGLYTEEVHMAWSEYHAARRRGEEPSLAPVWYAALGQLTAVLPVSEERTAVELTVELVELFNDAWCGGDHC